jgi:hypothetical protein
MSSTTDTISTIADQVLEGVSTAEAAALVAVDTLTNTLKPVTDQLPFAELVPDAKQTVEASFDFAKKIVELQKNFVVKLVDTLGA